MKKKTAAPDRTLARKLAEHHVRLTYSRIPAGSRHAMKRLLLDYIGVAIAGSQTESGVIAREFATLQGKATSPVAMCLSDRPKTPTSSS